MTNLIAIIQEVFSQNTEDWKKVGGAASLGIGANAIPVVTEVQAWIQVAVGLVMFIYICTKTAVAFKELKAHDKNN